MWQRADATVFEARFSPLLRGCRALGEPFLAPTRGALLAGCVSLWALRLGGYLFYRVMQVMQGPADGRKVSCLVLGLGWRGVGSDVLRPKTRPSVRPTH